jgi:cysteine synthase A
VRIGTSLTDVVGGTPVVQLIKVTPEGAADLFVKLEWFNPTGSYKDRMALAMVEEAERRGDLRPGMTVVEYTGGSTGSSLAFVCAAKATASKWCPPTPSAPRSSRL